MIKTFMPLLAAIIASLPSAALACPNAAGFPDYNCDGEFIVSFLGDSLVYGFGDKKNSNRGGYVLRLQKKFPKAQFINKGEQGLHTGPLLLQLADAFKEESKSDLRSALINSDVVVLDLGRNDRWDFGLPSATYRNLKRAAEIIRSGVEAAGKTVPHIVTAVLMLPNRGSQGPWVKELNTLIFKGHKNNNPADLRFDLVSKRLLGTDQIHPTSAGYDALFKAALNYFKTKLVPRLQKQRPDADQDGVYDLFEINRYGTDPANPDSDQDGLTDGQEIFQNSSDPLAKEG
jgi:lysophospholipase L1-like esterase